MEEREIRTVPRRDISEKQKRMDGLHILDEIGTKERRLLSRSNKEFATRAFAENAFLLFLFFFTLFLFFHPPKLNPPVDVERAATFFSRSITLYFIYAEK